jgi:predicted transcriptional regulator of viral defense system
MSGISAAGRTELTLVLANGGRFVRTQHAAETLGVDADAAAKKLARWAEDGWLRRVRRGLYIQVPIDAADPGSWSEDPLVVAAEVWQPCYFTGWTAASEWSLTDQVFRTSVLKTSVRVRSARASLLDHEYRIATISSRHLGWGTKSQWHGETRLRFADPARTMVDILDSPELGAGMRHGAEVLSAYLDQHDPQLLITYGDRLGNRTVFKRLGYAVEALGRELPGLVDACRSRASAGISTLDPDGPAGGRIAARWGLRVNVTIAPEEPA